MVTVLSRPAALNNWASGEYARGVRHRKVGAILHWMAGYLPGTTRTFQNPDTGYATSLGVGSRDGRGNGLEVHRYVPADGRSFGSYNADADTRGEAIEIENDIHLPYPGKPTPEVHELVAQLLAQLCVEEDWPLINGRRQLVLGDFPDHRFYERAIPQFGRDFNVTTHRSMALKDCPGSTDVQWIVDRGNEILGGAHRAADEPNEEDNMPKNSGVGWKRSDGVWQFMIFNTESGFEVNHTGTGGEYNSPLAAAFDTPNWATVSEGHAQLIKAGLDIVRRSKASGSVTLDIPDPVQIEEVSQ